MTPLDAVPGPLGRWHVAALVAVIGCFVGGLVCATVGVTNRTVATFAATFYVPAAAYGMTQAARGLRYHFAAKHFVEGLGEFPVSIQIDGDSGYATITKYGGELVSLQIPNDVLEEGPEAVMAFVVAELDVD